MTAQSSVARSGLARAPIRVLCTLALMAAMPRLCQTFESRAPVNIQTEFGPTNVLLELIRKGTVADIAIMTRASIDENTGDGTFDPVSRTDLALAHVGVAVRAGAPQPDIRSVEAFRLALLQARSVAYSRTGASGIYFAELIRRLGIENDVNSKAVVTPGGLTAQCVADGRCDLAIQQISELLTVPGVDIVGPLPPGIENSTIFTGAVFGGSKTHEHARAFLQFLASPDASSVMRSTGLDAPPLLAPVVSER